MIGFPYVAQLLIGYHLNFSPKVAVPGFVGLTTISIACLLDHFHYNIPFAALCLGVVQVMIFIGWLVPDPSRAATQREAEAIVSERGSK